MSNEPSVAFSEICRLGWNDMPVPKFNSSREFFEAGFSLTSDDRSGNFKIEFSPWIRLLCDWFDDPNVEDIFQNQASQTGKTSFDMGVLLFVSQHVSGPVPVSWFSATDEEAKDFIKERLKHFLDSADKEALKDKRLKPRAFRVFNSPVRVGYSTSEITMRQKPARFTIGDETSTWSDRLNCIAYIRKRSRTFEGIKKHIWSTTPPRSGKHYSWTEAINTDYYCWEVPCPHCSEFQILRFAQLDFSSCRSESSEEWDEERILKETKYKCVHCAKHIEEGQKLNMINAGRPICVNPENYEPRPDRGKKGKCLQISSLYSIFTPWGKLAKMFLDAKAGGRQAIEIFITDELTEVPQEPEQGKKLDKMELKKYISQVRKSGFVRGYDLYTGGVDVQRNGEIYYTISGWKKAKTVVPDILQYGILPWKVHKNVDWSALLELSASYSGNIARVFIDSSDGEVTQDVYDFCNLNGSIYIPLKEFGVQQIKVKFRTITVDSTTKRKLAFGHNVVFVNSHMIKDEISGMFSRDPESPDSPSFPVDVSQEYLWHFTNERKVKKNRGGREVEIWEPRYGGAPQHYFSAFVYSVAAMEEWRGFLQTSGVVQARNLESKGKQWLQKNQNWLRR